MKRIAIVEDDAEERARLAAMLSTRFRTILFQDGSSFLRALHRDTFDLVCLDWTLPDMSGIDMVERIRAGVLAKSIPIILVTARNGDEDLVQGLMSGADDFVSKPVRPTILAARVEALLRRSSPDLDAAFETYEDFTFDRSREVVTSAEAEHVLTSKEFALALTLFRNMHRPLARSYLMEEVWGVGANVSSRTLDTHVCRLKNKLGLTPDHGYSFGPVYGFGYRLERTAPPMMAEQPAG
ncbi:MAG TPA: response regulator transcription factor [Caulobacteraceae bacterium]|nr:response regulator transcription factor [Caulobacteraceae bacterium]